MHVTLLRVDVCMYVGGCGCVNSPTHYLKSDVISQDRILRCAASAEIIIYTLARVGVCICVRVIVCVIGCVSLVPILSYMSYARVVECAYVCVGEQCCVRGANVRVRLRGAHLVFTAQTLHLHPSRLSKHHPVLFP